MNEWLEQTCNEDRISFQPQTSGPDSGSLLGTPSNLSHTSLWRPLTWGISCHVQHHQSGCCAATSPDFPSVLFNAWQCDRPEHRARLEKHGSVYVQRTFAETSHLFWLFQIRQNKIKVHTRSAARLNAELMNVDTCCINRLDNKPQNVGVAHIMCIIMLPNEFKGGENLDGSLNQV